MKYRVVTNGEIFMIQYRFRFWPFWFLHEPARIRGIYQPIDWTKYRFDTKQEAEKYIEVMKADEKKMKWKVA